MKPAEDRRRLAITVLSAVWVLAFVYSFVALLLSGEEGDQVSRAIKFLGWQGVSAICSVGIYGISRDWPRKSAVRRLGAWPMYVAIFLALSLLALTVWALR